MSFLKNMLSNSVTEGIGKGIQDAVGKAVEGAVRPAADKLAGQAAEHLNQTSQALNESTQAIRESQDAAAEAARPVQTAQTPGSGAAALESALSGWASAMQGAATKAAMCVKQCPVCGAGAPADQKFCPQCGAKLPEQTVGAGYVCPKCGKQNLIGAAFCGECGALLPAAEAEHDAQEAKWDRLLADYPRWTQGGVCGIQEDGEMNGYPVVRLRVEGADHTAIRGYIQSLLDAGFTAFDGPGGDRYFKVTGGVCRCFDQSEAFSSGGMTVAFYVADLDARYRARQQTPAAKKTVSDTADLAKDAAQEAVKAAKGLFKKFF